MAQALAYGHGGPRIRSSGISNYDVADALARVAALLEVQNGNRFRIRAYQKAAARIRGLERPLWEIVQRGGLVALEDLPDIGSGLAASIEQFLRTGRLPLLARLEGEICPEALFMTVPGIGERMAQRIHADLAIDTLEELELAAHDGRLDTVPGFGPRRVQAVKETLASMLGRASRLRSLTARVAAGVAPSVEHGSAASGTGETVIPVTDLLAIDREYRELAAKDALVRITPRRFNPDNARWLPVFHTELGPWTVTALFSNTALAHRLGRTHDWVVIYSDRDGSEERHTVVTERQGDMAGFRVVRGREAETRAYYLGASARLPPVPVESAEPFLPGFERREIH